MVPTKRKTYRACIHNVVPLAVNCQTLQTNHSTVSKLGNEFRANGVDVVTFSAKKKSKIAPQQTRTNLHNEPRAMLLEGKIFTRRYISICVFSRH